MKIQQELISQFDGTYVCFEIDLDSLTLIVTRNGDSSSTSYASLETLVFGYETAARELFATDVFVDPDGRENEVLDVELVVRRAAEVDARADLAPVDEFAQRLVDQTRESIDRTRQAVGTREVRNAVFSFDGFCCRRIEYNVAELPFDGEDELRRLSWSGLSNEGEVVVLAEQGDYFIDLHPVPSEVEELLDGRIQPYDVPYIMSWVCEQLEPGFGFAIYVTFTDDRSIDFGARERATVGESLESFLLRGE